VHRVEREGAVEVGHEQVWIRFLDDGAELLRDGRHMRRKSHAATALLRGVRGKATPGTPSPSRRPVFTVDGGVFITAVSQVCEMQPILTIALCCSVRDGDDLCGAQQNTLEQPCWSHVPVAPVRCAGIWARAPLRLRGSGTFDGAGEDSPQRCVCAQREPVRSRAPHAHGQGHALTFGGRGTDPNH